jgi:hypothetical protein
VHKIFKKMKSVFLNVAFMFVAVFAASGQNSSITVKIKYTENGKIIPNTVVYLLYQEPGKAELIEKSANTGDGKEVSFTVPFDKDNASYPFVVLYSKEDVNKTKELAKTSTIRAFRSPPGDKCEFLGLNVTKGGGMGTEGCAIQMWSMGKK